MTDNKKLTDRNILKNVFSRFFISSMLAIICGCIGSIVGSIVIGNYLSEDLLGILSLALPVYYVFATIGNLLGIGGSTYCAKLIGERRYIDCKKVFTITYILNFAVCILFSVALIIFLPQTVKLLGTPSNLEADMYQYCFYKVIGGCFTAGVYLSFNFLRLDGRTAETTFTFIIMGVVNIVLDFVLVPFMGTRGAAIADISGQAVATIFGIIVILIKSNLLGFCKIPRKEFFPFIGNVIKIGSPGATENISILLKSYVFNQITVVMIGHGVLKTLSVINSINSFSLAFTSGCAGALIPLVGVFTAERDNVSIRRLVKSALLTTMYMIVPFMAAVYIFAPNIAAVFGISENASDTILAIRLFIISIPFALLSNSLIYFHLANKHTFLANVLTLLRWFGFAVSTAFLLMNYFGFVGLWISFTITDIITLITAIIIQFFIKRKNKDLSLILLLDTKFEKNGSSFAEVTPDDDESISAMIDKLNDFCRNNDFTRKRSMLIRLALDEMARLAAKYSTVHSKSHIISIRVLVCSDILIMRLRYEGDIFNPIEYYENLHADKNNIEAMLELEDFLGVKMLVDLCEIVDYKATFGLNNLTVITDKIKD